MVEKTLQERMLEAIKANDVAAQEALAAEIIKSRSARIKAESEAATKEATKLAGVRTELAEVVGASAKKLVAKVFFNDKSKEDETNKRLAAVKATGYYFEYSVEKGLSYGLRVPAVKTVKAKGTGVGGHKGSLQANYELFKGQYAVAVGVDIDTEMSEALEKDRTVSNQGFSYNVKKKVQKWAIAQGLLQPAK